MTGSPFPGAVLATLADAADRPVFEHGPRLVTGAEVLDLISRAAAGLRAEKIGRGDGVALVLSSFGPAVFATIVAAHSVGARVVALRPGLPQDHVQYLVGMDNVVVITDSEVEYEPRTLTVAGLCAANPGPIPVDGRPTDVARLIHTSGSTGVPKPVAQTYAGMTAEWAWTPSRWPRAIRELAPRMGRFLLFRALASQVVFQYTAMTIVAGGTVVVAELRDPEPLTAAIARLRITSTVVTVPMLTSMITDQRGRPADLSTLRAVLVSGSPLSPGRHREALEVLGPVVFHGYGQTEAGMIAMTTPDEPAGTVGIPADSVHMEIRDPDGVVVPDGADGEIFVRTPGQAIGYWADPGLSAEIFVDGWVRTRDLGHRDADGRLHLTGRARDVVIVDARVHYLGPIEQVIAEHPDVLDAYVVAVPDDRTGEAPHAFVVPAAGREPDADELRAKVAGRLGAGAAPRQVTVIDKPPVGPSGKPDKQRLLDLTR
jgi:acyl-CoA synthetase (AMP-forming)/AMP-acid ligase II